MDMHIATCQRLNLIGPQLAENGARADNNDQFCPDNLELLQQHGVYSALVPHEFGGGGESYADVATLLRQLATYHPSSALACSMHTHIVAANLFNHLHGKPGAAVLEKAGRMGKTLISTGAGDWLASSGEMIAVEGGFRLDATKHFASGSVCGDVLVTSAPYEDPEEGWQVLHFPLPMAAEGVSVLDNWQPMGMRGSGSNSVRLDNVFLPAESVGVKRSRGDFHAVYCVVLPVALPLIMSVYCGIAQSAATRARDCCAGSADPVTPYILGEMETALTTAQVMVDDMVRLVAGLDFTPSADTVNEIVKRKTVAVQACKQTVAKAMEVAGGRGFMRGAGIENLLRDVLASHFHPLQEKRQHLFTGSLAMGQEPPGQAF